MPHCGARKLRKKSEKSYASCYQACCFCVFPAEGQENWPWGGHFYEFLWNEVDFSPIVGPGSWEKNRRSESWRLICIMFSGLSCRCVFLHWNSMDVLLSKTGNTSPKWDVSTKKMGGSPECASFYAQKCPTKSKPYLRMMCARTQHLNFYKIVCYWNQVFRILTKLFFKFDLTFFLT